MNIQDILSPERTFCNIEASSRKRALEEIATQLAKTISDVDAEEIFTRLVAREKMGSTALGDGIAIPHCRLNGCPSVLGGLFTLQNPIDFEAFDRTEVQVLFVLLVPEEEVNEHLTVLALLASRFEQATYRRALLAAKDATSLYQTAIADIEPDVKQAHQ